MWARVEDIDERRHHVERRGQIGVPEPDAFRAGLRAALSPVKRIDRFDPSPFRSQVAAQVDDFDPLAWMPAKTARQLDRFSQFGLVTGQLALEDAALRPGEGGAASPERIGIYLGSALGGIAYAGTNGVPEKDVAIVTVTGGEPALETTLRPTYIPEP